MSTNPSTGVMATTAASSSSGLTSAQLVVGEFPPKTQVEGKIAILWRGLGDGPQPRLYFGLKVRLPVVGDYATGTALASYQMRIKVFSDNSKRLEEDRVALEEAQKSKATVKVDLSGARLVSLETNDKTQIVNIECNAPRKVYINGAGRTIGGVVQRAAPEWFHTPSPAPPSQPKEQENIPQPQAAQTSTVPRTQSMPMKPLSYQLGALNFRAEPPAQALKRSSSTNGESPSKRQRVESHRAPATQPVGQSAHAQVASVALDLSTARSAAPPQAVEPAPPRFLPTPSTGVSSRPETIETPPSSSLPASGTADRIESSTDKRRREEQGNGSQPQAKVPPGSAPHSSVPRQEAVQGNHHPSAASATARPAPSQPRRDAEDAEAVRLRRKQVAKAVLHGSHTSSPSQKPTQEHIPPPSKPSASSNAGMDLEARRKAVEAKSMREAAAKRAAEKETAAQYAAGISTLSSDFTCIVGGRQIQYRPLARCTPGTMSIMGVVVDIIGAAKRISSSGDYMRTIIIGDPSTHINSTGNDDTNVALYRKTPAETDGFQVGMPVVFRNLTMRMWQNRPKGNAFSNAYNEWYILAGDQIIHGKPVFGKSEPLTRPEKQRLLTLRAWWQAKIQDMGAPSPGLAPSQAPSSSLPASSASEAGRSSRKARYLKEVQAGMFFDLTAKIIKVFPNDFAQGSKWKPLFEIYVADGTVHDSNTRNFHGVYTQLPPSAVFCVAIFDNGTFEGKNKNPFKEGGYMHFPNMRCTERDGLELKWSDNVTTEQERQGWKVKVTKALSLEDPRVIEIQQRISDLEKKTRDGIVPAPVTNANLYQQPVDPVFAPPPVPMLAVAKHISTQFTDEFKHPVRPLSAVLEDNTANQRIRTRAKVTRVIGRGSKGSQTQDLAVLWCSKCKQPFPANHCQSCDDKTLAKAQAVYQMVLLLEAPDSKNKGEPTKAYVVLSGDEAEAILPPLPLVHGGPNEVGRARRTISELTRRVEETLLGNTMDGERTHPVIDWTLESFYDGPPGKLVKVWRVFGMKKRE